MSINVLHPLALSILILIQPPFMNSTPQTMSNAEPETRKLQFVNPAPSLVSPPLQRTPKAVVAPQAMRKSGAGGLGHGSQKRKMCSELVKGFRV